MRRFLIGCLAVFALPAAAQSLPPHGELCEKGWQLCPAGSLLQFSEVTSFRPGKPGGRERTMLQEAVDPLRRTALAACDFRYAVSFTQSSTAGYQVKDASYATLLCVKR